MTLSLERFILDCAEDCINSAPPSGAVVAEQDGFPLTPAPDSALSEAPTDLEYISAWRESIMPDFDVYDGSCGCGEKGCAAGGRC